MTNLQIRNRDFIYACKLHASRLVSAGGVPEISEIIARVLADEAPSYYLDPEYALRRVREMLAGLPPEDRRLAHLLRDVNDYLAQNPGATDADAVYAICEGDFGSPRFYITQRQARYILRDHNKSLRKHL